MPESLYVSCLGLVCPVGFTPESAAAALRAGIAGFTDLPYADQTGERIVGALVPGLTDDLRGRARLVELLARAFEFIGPRLPQSVALTDLPVILCTREPDRPGANVEGIVSEIEMRLRLNSRRDGSGHIASGPVAAFEALMHASRLLAARRTEVCLIAAVDTFVDARTLCWLDDTKRLKTAMQSDGVIPGEAACVAIVSKRPVTPSHLAVRGLGLAVEIATVVNEEPLLGKGMTAAARHALREAGLGIHEVDFRISDVAGESYAFEELALALSRLTRQPRESQELWHPADCIGDCGAAAGLIQFSWVEQAFLRGYAPGPVALVHASTSTGARAAAVLGI
jgi:3-oxoacyl-[acyl-carrier-protein] synthase-1